MIQIIASVLTALLLQRPAGPPASTDVKKLEKGLYAIGPLRVDVARREVSVPATVNDAQVLEFVANTRGGLKAYESLLTIETDAIRFNTALILIGLDPTHARVPTQHFDPVAPSGDPVDVWVEWTVGGKSRQVRIEQLLFDKRTNHSLPEGPWVYTGSTFLSDINGDRFMADTDGVLIGFVHSPAPIIENPRAGAVDAYGFVVFNQEVGLRPGTPVTLKIRALP